MKIYLKSNKTGLVVIMKKYTILYILCGIFIFSCPAKCEETLPRGLFVTMVQDPPVLSSRKEITKLIGLAKRARINTLFVQIYRANEAWFPSRIASSAPYEACLKNVSEDPLRLLIRQAHLSGIEVHAWLNMLSLGQNEDAALLKKYGADILTKNLRQKKRLGDYKIDDQYFLEPGDLRVRQELSGIVEEILVAYPELDGIQFDYLRYPDKDPFYGYTNTNMARFKEATGLKTIEEDNNAWKDWKRQQVTATLEELAGKARALRPNIQISATGCMPYSRAYHEAFQDWPSWIKRGLVDFVTVMSYSPDIQEFKIWIEDIKERIPDFRKVNIGIGAYKFVHSPVKFKKEFRFSEKLGGRCIIFHYGSLLQNPALINFLVKDQGHRAIIRPGSNVR